MSARRVTGKVPYEHSWFQGIRQNPSFVGMTQGRVRRIIGDDGGQGVKASGWLSGGDAQGE